MHLLGPMMRVAISCALLGACNNGAPAQASAGPATQAEPGATSTPSPTPTHSPPTPVAMGPAPSASGGDAAPPAATTITISRVQGGPDVASFDYPTTEDVFVDVKLPDASRDGHVLRLAALAPNGGGAMIAYETKVASGAAVFDFAVSGTPFGRNAQPGTFTFVVSDVTAAGEIGRRPVAFTRGAP